jgi:hypothetical protein
VPAVNRDAGSALNNEFLGTSSARKHLKMLLSVNGIIYLIMDIVQVFISQFLSNRGISIVVRKNKTKSMGA